MLPKFIIRIQNLRVMKDVKYDFCSDGTFILKKYKGKESNKTYKIPDKVTFIGSEAFKNNQNLTCIFASKGLETIYFQAFKNCSSLKRVVLFDELKHIGDAAFSDCKSLNLIKLPDSIKEIGAAAFSNCISLKTINWPKKAKCIRSYTFKDCLSLECVIIPQTVKKIEAGAFANCPLLESIMVSHDCVVDEKAIDKERVLRYENKNENKKKKEVTTVLRVRHGSRTIRKIDLNNTIDLYLPRSVKDINGDIFLNAKDLNNVYYDGTIEDWCTINFEKAFSNPMSVANHLYFKNADGKYEEVTNIRIPKTINRLKDYQFLNLKSLTSIILETGWIKEVGVQCFKNCKNLKSISIEGEFYTNWERGDVGLKRIGKSAFEGCSSLESVEFRHSYYNLSWTRNYYYSIGEKAFKNCVSFKGFKLPNLGWGHIESLDGNEIFMNTAIESINFDNKVDFIPKRTFYGCKNLKEFKVTSGKIKEIGEEAFAGTALLGIEVDVSTIIAQNALPSLCLVSRSFDEETKKEKNKIIYAEQKRKKEIIEREKSASSSGSSSTKENELSKFLALARQGDVDAMCKVAIRFEVKGEYDEALYWYQKASEKGNSYAKQRVSGLKLRGYRVDSNYHSPSASPHIAETPMMQREKNLSASELYNEAKKYLIGGIGYSKNEKKAFSLFLRGAEKGDRYCQNQIACFYENGQIVTKDLSKALMWYQRAANQGLNTAKERVAALSPYVEAAVDVPNENFRGLKPKETNNYNSDISISTFVNMLKERLSAMTFADDCFKEAKILSCNVSGYSLIVDISAITSLEEDEIKVAPPIKNENSEYENKALTKLDEMLYKKQIDLANQNKKIIEETKANIKKEITRIVNTVFSYVNVVDRMYETNDVSKGPSAKRLKNVVINVHF